MVGVDGSSPFAPTKFGRKIKHLAETLGAFFLMCPKNVLKGVGDQGCLPPFAHGWRAWCRQYIRGVKARHRRQSHVIERDVHDSTRASVWVVSPKAAAAIQSTGRFTVLNWPSAESTVGSLSAIS